MRIVDNEFRQTHISEPIFQVGETVNEFDITYIDYSLPKISPINPPSIEINDRLKDYKPNGEINKYAYHVKLVIKIANISPSKRKAFIDYQLNIHQNPILWLYEIEELLNRNSHRFFDKSSRDSYRAFMIIIKKKIEELENPEKLIKSELYWQKTDTALLELITALIESGSINNQSKNLTRKDAIQLFEIFLNHPIKDAGNKLSKATARKIDQTPFINILSKAFTDYCDRKLD